MSEQSVSPFVRRSVQLSDRLTKDSMEPVIRVKCRVEVRFEDAVVEERERKQHVPAWRRAKHRQTRRGVSRAIGRTM